MKQLYVIRGLPGSGKSTLAQQIADEWFEADRYFMVAGVYKFDKEQLTDAHIWCQAQVDAAMHNEARSIAVSNTFVRRWEIEPYTALALKYGYTVTEMTMTGPLRPNTHGVSDTKIEIMRARWEK
jgi:predicted kinase